jgi:hypothetical protein
MTTRALESSHEDVEEEYAFIKGMWDNFKPDLDALDREVLDRFLEVPVVFYRFKAGEIEEDALERLLTLQLAMIDGPRELRNRLFSSFMLTENVLRRCNNGIDFPWPEEGDSVKYLTAFTRRDAIRSFVFGGWRPSHAFRLKIISVLTILCSSRARGDQIGKLAGEHFRYLASFLYKI